MLQSYEEKMGKTKINMLLPQKYSQNEWNNIPINGKNCLILQPRTNYIKNDETNYFQTNLLADGVIGNDVSSGARLL